MNDQKEYARFKSLKFDDFKLMANDKSLSKYQKIGFPDSYRQGKEEKIFHDIINKLQIDQRKKGLTLLDIGPGCTDLPLLILQLCQKLGYRVLLADCEEMLSNLPSGQNILKYPGNFPDDTTLVDEYQQKVDYIVCYSVLHAVFSHSCIYRFLDNAVSLLKPGGKMLLGDIPNLSKRRRFFTTDAGVKFHQNFTKTSSLPAVNHLELEHRQIDDSVIFSILQRYRNFGFETYLLSQPPHLPMANRREDILITRS